MKRPDTGIHVIIDQCSPVIAEHWRSEMNTYLSASSSATELKSAAGVLLEIDEDKEEEPGFSASA